MTAGQPPSDEEMDLLVRVVSSATKMDNEHPISKANLPANNALHAEIYTGKK